MDVALVVVDTEVEGKLDRVVVMVETLDVELVWEDMLEVEDMLDGKV